MAHKCTELPQGLSSQNFWAWPCIFWTREWEAADVDWHSHLPDCWLKDLYCNSWNTWKKLTLINIVAAAWTLVNQGKSRNCGMKFCTPVQVFETWVTQRNRGSLFPRMLLHWCPFWSHALFTSTQLSLPKDFTTGSITTGLMPRVCL